MSRSLLRSTYLGWIALPLIAVPMLAHAARIDVGAGQSVPTPSAVPWQSLQPGDQVVIHAGIYADPVVITSQGSSGKPILVVGEGNVEIDNSVVLEGASFVTIRGLGVRNAQYSGFILRHGAHDDTIANSSVANSGLGIWIGDGSGGRHRLLNNDIHDNRTHGIAIDVINLSPGQETIISGNKISRNVMHGIEVNGSYYIVENNIVQDNGTGLSGTSGIHLYAKSPDQGTGQHVIIRYNVVSGQKETSGQDGNGIQLDQWCDNNQVYFNVAFNNDGAGIVLFDAADNVVANNTLFGNMRDSGGRHAYKADLVMASDYTKNVDHVFGNIIVNNLVYTTSPRARPVYVDRFAAPRMEMFGNNIFYRTGGAGPLYFWAGAAGTDIAALNGLKAGVQDRMTDPLLADPAQAAAQASAWRGLAPTPNSPAAASGVDIGLNVQHDAAGVPITQMPIGALEPAAE